MSKHTKGPWIAVENDGAYVKDPKFATWCIEERGSAAEMVVAVVISDVALLANKVEANARLIAAAPEMLEALKDAYPFVADDTIRIHVGTIIAKAEGRS